MSPKKNIAFFDFDGTITSEDSLKHFLFYYFNWLQLIAKSLAFLPYLMLYKLKIINNSKAKEQLFVTFFKGKSIEEFQLKCDRFSEAVLPKLINKNAQQKMIWHKNNGDEIVVVSASIENYLKAFFLEKGIVVISTELELIDGRISGKFVGNNCYGEEKRRKILSAYDLSDYDCIYAYGDSEGDKEMLELAHQAHYKVF